MSTAVSIRPAFIGVICVVMLAVGIAAQTLWTTWAVAATTNGRSAIPGLQALFAIRGLHALEREQSFENAIRLAGALKDLQNGLDDPGSRHTRALAAAETLVSKIAATDMDRIFGRPPSQCGTHAVVQCWRDLYFAKNAGGDPGIASAFLGSLQRIEIEEALVQFAADVEIDVINAGLGGATFGSDHPILARLYLVASQFFA